MSHIASAHERRISLEEMYHWRIDGVHEKKRRVRKIVASLIFASVYLHLFHFFFNSPLLLAPAPWEKKVNCFSQWLAMVHGTLYKWFMLAQGFCFCRLAYEIVVGFWLSRLIRSANENIYFVFHLLDCTAFEWHNANEIDSKYSGFGLTQSLTWGKMSENRFRQRQFFCSLSVKIPFLFINKFMTNMAGIVCIEFNHNSFWQIWKLIIFENDNICQFFHSPGWYWDIFSRCNSHSALIWLLFSARQLYDRPIEFYLNKSQFC